MGGGVPKFVDTAPMTTPKDLLTLYDQGFRTKFHVAAPIVAGKDAKLAEGLLRHYSLAQLTRWLDRFFVSRDRVILQSGFTFGAFVSGVGRIIVANVERPAMQIDPQVVALAKRIRLEQRILAEERAQAYYQRHPWVRQRHREP